MRSVVETVDIETCIICVVLVLSGYFLWNKDYEIQIIVINEKEKNADCLSYFFIC